MSSEESNSDIIVSSESERSLEELYSSFASLEVLIIIYYIKIAYNGRNSKNERYIQKRDCIY